MLYSVCMITYSQIVNEMAVQTAMLNQDRCTKARVACHIRSYPDMRSDVACSATLRMPTSILTQATRTLTEAAA